MEQSHIHDDRKLPSRPSGPGNVDSRGKGDQLNREDMEAQAKTAAIKQQAVSYLQLGYDIADRALNKVLAPGDLETPDQRYGFVATLSSLAHAVAVQIKGDMDNIIQPQANPAPVVAPTVPAPPSKN